MSLSFASWAVPAVVLVVVELGGRRRSCHVSVSAGRKGFKAGLDGLRERMRSPGIPNDEIVAEIGGRYRARPREAYRLYACGFACRPGSLLVPGGDLAELYPFLGEPHPDSQLSGSPGLQALVGEQQGERLVSGAEEGRV